MGRLDDDGLFVFQKGIRDHIEVVKGFAQTIMGLGFTRIGIPGFFQVFNRFGRVMPEIVNGANEIVSVCIGRVNVYDGAEPVKRLIGIALLQGQNPQPEHGKCVLSIDAQRLREFHRCTLIVALFCIKQPELVECELIVRIKLQSPFELLDSLFNLAPVMRIGALKYQAVDISCTYRRYPLEAANK